MRKILSIILMTAMVLSSFALISCETERDSNTSTPVNTAEGTPVTGETTTSQSQATPSITLSSTPTPTPTPTRVDKAAELEKLISDAQKKTTGLESLDFDISETSKEIGDNYTYEQTLTMNLKVSGLNTDKIIYKATEIATVNGVEYTSVLFYSDGYYYIDDGEDSFKMTAEEMGMEQTDDVGSSIANTLVSLPKEVLENAVVTDIEDGSKTVEVSLTSEKFVVLFKEHCDVIVSEVTMGEEAESAEFSDAKVIVIVNPDGYFTSYAIECGYEISCDFWGDGEITVSKGGSKNVFDFNNPGEKVDITLPEGYEDFMTYDEYLSKVWGDDGDVDIDITDDDYADLNWDAESWEEFAEINDMDVSEFDEIREVMTWAEFKLFMGTGMLG